MYQVCSNQTDFSGKCEEWIKSDKVDYIISSTDEYRQDKLVLMNEKEMFEIFKEETKPIEEKLVKLLISLHNIVIHKWEYSI